VVFELPLVPHWRLGFSGPLGKDIYKSLTDWSKTLSGLGMIDNTVELQVSQCHASTKHHITVGFVSSWFCNSAVGRLMLGLIRELDRTRFQSHLFHIQSISGKVPSAVQMHVIDKYMFLLLSTSAQS
jgi:predicted O-linked N-acetylglucosamine transferase (SPINDLY family)